MASISRSRAWGSRQPARRPNCCCHGSAPGPSAPTPLLFQRGPPPPARLLVPARPSDFRRIRPLASGRHHPPVDAELVGVRMEVELGLDPRAAIARDVLVPDLGRLPAA